MIDLQEDDTFRALADGLVGQTLPGSEGRWYPLRERIGDGGQGWVFRATWNGSIDVVVKVLRPDAASPESLARFQREAQVLRMLSQQPSPNPHIVRFFDHAVASIQVAATGKSWELPFTVLEFVDGETLETALTKAQPSGMGLDRARRILRHIVLALQDVHAQGVVHRDLKPSNILVASPGGREIAKVTDFGLAKLLDPGMQRTTHLAGATVGYAPPEQFENGNLRVGRHTDVFSLAAIFYELVSGVPAFPVKEFEHPLMVVIRILNDARPAFARVRDQIPRELAERPDVVEALDAELSRALSPDPAQRHATITDLHQAIERVLDGLRSAPSAVFAGAHGGLLVRPSLQPEGSPDDSMALAKTAPLPETTPSKSDLSAPPAGVEWRRVTSPWQPDAWLAIAAAPSGDRAFGVGALGAAVWERGAWTRVDLPPAMDPSRLRAVACFNETTIFAGASPIVVALSPRATPAVWRFDAPGLAFHGVYADAAGIVLVGERSGAAGPVGVLVEIPSGPTPARLIDVNGSGPLRAATRLSAGILACGDAGTLALMAPAGAPRIAQVCQPPLFALLAMSDGTAVTVGGGGFVYRVWPTLETRLDAIQTTRDLFTLARAPDGTLFCGGAAGRVLRRETQGWARVGGNAGDGRVRALHIGASRVLAFGDDGGVTESVVP